MKHYKKIISLLVLLLTAATGAWAEEKMVTINSSTMSSGAVTTTGFNIIFDNYLYVNKNPATITTSEGVITKLVIKKSDVYVDAFNEANVGVTPGTITYGSDEITVTDINAESVTLSIKGDDYWSTSSVDVYYGAPTGTPVTVTKSTTTANTWSLTMPAGNVEVTPEYYPQATVGDGGVTAATGVQATTDAELVTIDKSKFTGASGLKYIVTTNATPTPAYDATGWTDEVPTAANITTVGLTYVWYYPVGKDDGDNSYSDGNICEKPIEVNIAPAPTYAVTFADGIDEADKWTASPNTGATKGTTINVTYTGSKKVLGLKAEKRVSLAYPIAISEVTDEAYIGSVVADDGYVYATIDDVESASKTAVAIICYVGNETGDATYNHGLALALYDVSDTKEWSPTDKKCLDSQYTTVADAKGDLAGIANTDALVNHTGHTHHAAVAAIEFKYKDGVDAGAHPSGTSKWFLPSVGQWDKMATAVGDYLKLGLNLGSYWSSTEFDAELAWALHTDDGSWINNKKYYDHWVRACIAF